MATLFEKSKKKIQAAQGKDAIIGKALDKKDKTVNQINRHLRMNIPGVVALMWLWTKLYICEDGILCRRTQRREQLLLPKIYNPLVFGKLHQEMGYLGLG